MGTMSGGAPLDPPYGSVPLYISTLRTDPAGMAVLRAELHEAPEEYKRRAHHKAGPLGHAGGAIQWTPAGSRNRRRPAMLLSSSLIRHHRA